MIVKLSTRPQLRLAISVTVSLSNYRPRCLPFPSFHISRREVGEMLLERGIEVFYEAIRRWCIKLVLAYIR